MGRASGASLVHLAYIRSYLVFVPTAGELNLPIRLDATVVYYDRECSDLDTTGQRYDIYDVVRTTIQKSRLYRYFN